MVNPRLKSVAPLSDYVLLLTFENAEGRLFDVKPYLTNGVFAALADQSLFRSVPGCSTRSSGPTVRICVQRFCTKRASR